MKKYGLISFWLVMGMVSFCLWFALVTLSALEPEKCRNVPSNPVQRREIAERLFKKIDAFNVVEKERFKCMGDEAFKVLFPHFKELYLLLDDWQNQLAQAWKNNLKDTPEYQQLYKKVGTLHHKVDYYLDILPCNQNPQHTKQLLEVYYSSKSILKSSLQGVLWSKGDPDQMIAFAEWYLDDLVKNRKYDKTNGWISALRYLERFSHPSIADFFGRHLENPDSLEIIRHIAFQNLPGIADEKGIQAVIKAKDRNRQIPALEVMMGLEYLGLETNVYKGDPYIYEQRFIQMDIDLLSTQKDESGTLWGLVCSNVLGLEREIWLVKWNGASWTSPLFLDQDCTRGRRGYSGNNCNIARYLSRLEEISKDSDNDGWSDKLEKKIGTSMYRSDSDNDGLIDSQDKNPLAAPRALNDTEQVIAAAYEATHKFDKGRIHYIRFPEGIEPLEVFGDEYLHIPIASGNRILKRSIVDGGRISFSQPWVDLKGNMIPFISDDASFIEKIGYYWEKWYWSNKYDGVVVWNSNHTEAKVSINMYRAPLAGGGADVYLKKYGNEWIVTACISTWVS